MNISHSLGRSVLIAGVASLATVVVLSMYAHSRMSAHRAYLDSSFATIEDNFVREAESADRTEVTEKISKTIIDCEARSEFDTLLSRLSSLGAIERARLDYLYSDCADFFYRVKQEHAAELEDLYRIYATHRAHSDALYAPHVLREKRGELMATIITIEQQRTDAMLEQVTLQREVMTALENNIDSEALLADRINEVARSLADQNELSDRARGELVELLKI